MSDNTGSFETLKESGITVSDQLTGNTVKIYESVLNSQRIDAKNWNELRYYVVPQFLFYVQSTNYIDANEYFEYTFKLICYYDLLIERVVNVISDSLKITSNNKFLATQATVNRMTHKQVKFSVNNIDGAKINDIGSLDSNIVLNNVQNITFLIPKGKKEEFENKIKDKTLTVTAELYYQSKDISISKFQLNIDDINKSNTFKNISTSGAEYVNARQIQQIFKESALHANASSFEDPEVPQELKKHSNDIFLQLLNDFAARDDFVNDRNNMEKIDEYLREGTGLTAKDFAPITTMWEICDSLNKIDNYEEANKSIKEYYNHSTNKSTISGGAKASYNNFFGFKVGGGGSGFKEITKETIDKGYFSNENEFKNFTEYHRGSKGLEPKITGRGLELIEKAGFITEMQLYITSISFYPTNVYTKVSIIMNQLDEQQYNLINPKSPELINNIQLPVGTIWAYAGTIDNIPNTWLLCDGSPIPRTGQYTKLFNVINTIYGIGDNINTFNLPDLRGRVIIGCGKSNEFSNRSLGQYLGEENHTLTINEIPSHQHNGITDGGNTTKYRIVCPDHPHTDKDNSEKYQATAWHGGPRYTDINDSNYPVSIHTHNFRTNNTGNDNSHNNMQPSIVLNYIIRY